MSNEGTEPVRVSGGYVVKRTPGRLHKNFEDAGAEADRLANINGSTFLILQIVGFASPSEPAAHG